MFPTSLSKTEIYHFPRPKPASVEETITMRHRGWVKFEGTYWFAKFCDPETAVVALPGAIVTVVGRVANTLLVIPQDNLPEVQFMSHAEVNGLTQTTLPEAVQAKLHGKTLYVV
jgi:hypothetical protein